MEHKLPELPYSMDALAPHISQETLEFHYGKHHNTYVVNLNKLIQGTEFENSSLEDIVKREREKNRLRKYKEPNLLGLAFAQAKVVCLRMSVLKILAIFMNLQVLSLVLMRVFSVKSKPFISRDF